MVVNGLYKVKDNYYKDFPNENHIQIKQGRPFYYAVKDSHGMYWLIPLSTQVDKHKKKISDIEVKRGKGNCLIYHIGVIANKDMVFKICDMIPITDGYIAGEFIKYGRHYIVMDEKLIREISQKSRNFIRQLELGRMHSQVDALKIRDKLIEKTTLVRSI